MRIYIAADHAGYELKQVLLDHLKELGHEVEDCGAFEMDSADDYPDVVSAAARSLSNGVAEGLDCKAIVIGASGQGEAMVANRFKGVRCALYYGPTAHTQRDMAGKKLDMLASSREHNNANALSLGARFLDTEAAKKAVEVWLKTGFSGEERHVRRIEKIDSLT